MVQTCNEKIRRIWQYYYDGWPGKRMKGRVKRKWMDSFKHDLIEIGRDYRVERRKTRLHGGN